MRKLTTGLDIHKFFRYSNEYRSEIFRIEDDYSHDFITDHIAPRNERFFYLHHPQREELINVLGEQGTHTFNRLILLYFDAIYTMNEFLGTELNDLGSLKDDNINLKFMEDRAKKYKISDYSLGLKSAATFLIRYDDLLERPVEHLKTVDNELSEFVFAMNIQSIFRNFGISPFLVEQKKGFYLNDYDQGILKLLASEEFGMIILQWLSLNDYSRTDFSAGIYKIFEFVREDLEKNEDKFSKNEYFEFMKKMVSKINSDKWKRYYSGFLNNTMMLGVISRHGSKNRDKNESRHLRKVENLSTEDERNIKLIYENLNQGKQFPNISQLNYIYNLWHYTATCMISCWFITRKL